MEGGIIYGGALGGALRPFYLLRLLTGFKLQAFGVGVKYKWI